MFKSIRFHGQSKFGRASANLTKKQYTFVYFFLPNENQAASDFHTGNDTTVKLAV